MKDEIVFDSATSPSNDAHSSCQPNINEHQVVIVTNVALAVSKLEL